uniref:Structural protein n=1 Tax=Strongyloides papillosus TaxID=174720 RepID=A0A0N5BMH1_STREA
MAYVDFLKRVIEGVVNEVNNYPLVIKASDDMNNGFISTDNHSILSRTKIREIFPEFLKRLNEFGKVTISVNEISVQTRFDFVQSEFHKELEILNYNIIVNLDIDLKEELHHIDTKIELNIGELYEGDKEEITFGDKCDSSKVTGFTTVTILQKSGFMKKKSSDNEYTFNLHVSDFDGNIVYCVCVK